MEKRTTMNDLVQQCRKIFTLHTRPLTSKECYRKLRVRSKRIYEVDVIEALGKLQEQGYVRLDSSRKWSTLSRGLRIGRNTNKYHFKIGNKIVHTGITNNLARREKEHRRNYGKDGHIMRVGRATTRDSALKWERGQTRLGMPTRKES